MENNKKINYYAEEFYLFEYKLNQYQIKSLINELTNKDKGKIIELSKITNLSGDTRIKTFIINKNGFIYSYKSFNGGCSIILKHSTSNGFTEKYFNTESNYIKKLLTKIKNKENGN